MSSDTAITYSFNVICRQISGNMNGEPPRIRNETARKVQTICHKDDEESYPSLQCLQKLLRDIFKVGPKLSVFTYYIDAEAEMVRLSTEREWRELMTNSVAPTAGDGGVSINLIFSPKHHYKESVHGQVDFSKHNFATVPPVRIMKSAKKTQQQAEMSVEKQQEPQALPRTLSVQNVAPETTEQKTTPGQAEASDNANSAVIPATTSPSVDDDPCMIAPTTCQVNAQIDSAMAETHSGANVHVPDVVSASTESTQKESESSTTEVTISQESHRLISVFDRDNNLSDLCTEVRMALEPLFQEQRFLNEQLLILVRQAQEKLEVESVSQNIEVVSQQNIEPVINDLTEVTTSDNNKISNESVAENETITEEVEIMKPQVGLVILGGSTEPVYCPGGAILHRQVFVTNNTDFDWPENCVVLLENATGLFRVCYCYVTPLSRGHTGDVHFQLATPSQSHDYCLSLSLRLPTGDRIAESDISCRVTVLAVENVAISCGEAKPISQPEATLTNLPEADPQVDLSAAPFPDPCRSDSGCDRDISESEATDTNHTLADSDSGEEEDRWSPDITEDGFTVLIPDCFDMSRAPSFIASRTTVPLPNKQLSKSQSFSGDVPPVGVTPPTQVLSNPDPNHPMGKDDASIFLHSPPIHVDGFVSDCDCPSHTDGIIERCMFGEDSNATPGGEEEGVGVNEVEPRGVAANEEYCMGTSGEDMCPRGDSL